MDILASSLAVALDSPTRQPSRLLRLHSVSKSTLFTSDLVLVITSASGGGQKATSRI